MKQRGKFDHPKPWHEASLNHGIDILSGFRTRLHHLYHGGTRDGTIAARETIPWWQTLSWNGGLGMTLERRCQERLLRWSRKSSIMAADSIMEWTVVTITAARKTPYVICQQERLSHEGTEDSMSIMAVRETPSRWQKGLDMHRGSIRDSICR